MSEEGPRCAVSLLRLPCRALGPHQDHQSSGVYTFATVRLRTAKTRGCVSRNTILALVFRLGLSAEKHWIKLRGFQRLGQLIQGVKFADGTPIVTDEHDVEDGLISRSAA